MERTEVSDQLISELPDKRAALRACVMFSGKPLKTVAYELGIQADHLSKMLNPSHDPRHFPQEKENLLMDICGNEIPLRWALLKRGYASPRAVAALELENKRLKDELEQAKTDRKFVMNVFKSIPEESHHVDHV